MANDFQGSTAQENVQYTTEVTVTTTPGDNFYKLFIYVPFSSLSSVLVSTAGVLEGDVLTFTGSDYATQVKGTLLAKLNAFYKEQTAATTYVAFYGATSTIAVLHALYKSYAYWITLDSTVDDDWVALATLQSTNKDLNAPVVLSVESYDVTLADSILKALVDAKLDAWVFYAVTADDSQPALYQLGRSLSYTNASGTPVGNSLDYVMCSNIAAGGTDGANLSSTAKTTCEAANINYFNTVGNSTGAVNARGGKSLNATVMAAQWIVAYCNYVNRIKTAEIITRMNTFVNDATYFKIKQLIIKTVGLFTDTSGMGRLTGFKLTAPAFKDLPSGGDSIVVPNAWEATYVDNVRNVTVQGTLYITA